VAKWPDFEEKDPDHEITIFSQWVPASYQNTGGFLKFETFLSGL